MLSEASRRPFAAHIQPQPNQIIFSGKASWRSVSVNLLDARNQSGDL